MTTVTAEYAPVLGPAGATRLLGALDPGLTTHAQRFGPLPQLAPTALIAALDESGLTGRGGAGFPTGRKVAAIRNAGRAPAVVANGAEGEPLSRKDRVLLHAAPHLVLDGLALVAAAVGVDRRQYVYLPPDCRTGADRAITERSAARWSKAPTLVESPEHFLAGQESAVVNAIAGRKALPGDAPVRVSGQRRGPTLVCNVETLAQVALIARFGPRWFRAMGSAPEPGTRLVTVDGRRVLEVATDISVTQLFPGSADLRAILVGGYHGTWVPADRLGELRLSRESTLALGATPGAGVLLGLPRQECGLVRTAAIAGWLAGQSSGQCGPCRNGLPRMAQVLTRLAHGPEEPGLDGQVARLTSLVEGRGACHHPDGTARLVRSALQVFATDVALHLSGRCEARRG